MSQISENRNNFHCRSHFVRKSSAKTSMIPSLSYFLFEIRLFRISTSAAPMDIHLVRVPQDVDGKCQVKAREMRRTSRIFSVHVDSYVGCIYTSFSLRVHALHMCVRVIMSSFSRDYNFGNERSPETIIFIIYAFTLA